MFGLYEEALRMVQFVLYCLFFSGWSFIARKKTNFLKHLFGKYFSYITHHSLRKKYKYIQLNEQEYFFS